MRKLMSLATLCTCLIGLISTTTSQPSFAQKTSDVPVTSTIADVINSTPMQIQSDGAGGYVNSRYVQSIVQGAAADWELDTNYSTSSTRNVWLDFSKPVSGSGPNGGAPVAPFAAGLAKVRFISKCHLYNVNMFTIPTGSTVNCPLTTGFNYGGYQYRLQMNPTIGADVNPETDYVNITCSAANASSQCIDWLIEPNGSKGGCATLDCSVRQNIARLSKFVTSKGKTTEFNQGDFYVAFSIHLTNP